MEPVVEEGLSGEIFVSRLIRSCRTYQEDSSHWNEKIIDCARSVLKDVEVLMVYDYSSTVNAVLEEAESWGREIHVFVPESRTLDRGMPFIRNHRGSNLHFSLIPDCGMGYYIKDCDAVLVGMDMHCVGIELVPPKYITGYMTEKGFLVPGDISEGERRRD